MNGNITDAKSPITTESARDVTAALLPSGSSQSHPHIGIVSITKTNCQPEPDLSVEQASGDNEYCRTGPRLSNLSDNLNYPAKVWDLGNKGIFETELKPETREGLLVTATHFPPKSGETEEEWNDKLYPTHGNEVPSIVGTFNSPTEMIQSAVSYSSGNLYKCEGMKLTYSTKNEARKKDAYVPNCEYKTSGGSITPNEEEESTEIIQNHDLAPEETTPDERREIDSSPTVHAVAGSSTVETSHEDSSADVQFKAESPVVCESSSIWGFHSDTDMSTNSPEDSAANEQPERTDEEAEEEDGAEEVANHRGDALMSENEKTRSDEEHGQPMAQSLEGTSANSRHAISANQKQSVSDTFIKPSVEEKNGSLQREYTHRFLDSLREAYLHTYSKHYFYLMDSGLVLSKAKSEKFDNKVLVTMRDGVKLALTPSTCSDYRYQNKGNFCIIQKLNSCWYRGIDLGTKEKFLIKQVEVVNNWRKILQNFLFLPSSPFILLPYAVMTDRNGFIYFLMQDQDIKDFGMQLKEILNRADVYEVWLQFVKFCKRNQLQPHNFSSCTLSTPQGVYFDPTTLGNMEDLCSFKKSVISAITEEPWGIAALDRDRVCSELCEAVEEEIGEG
ncbi:uncharacterized protein LOC136716035 isoform X2 [Amia ocellicauda]|uniref:uncharacterized protein LOC136716035 isoform X2 n=1 Tax=Amia ocellicauda TaxID=2972642 RepID=UPI003463B80E